MKTVKKIVDVVVTTIELMPGILAVLGGAALIIGSQTGVLWY